jgi:hypothetical protein
VANVVDEHVSSCYCVCLCLCCEGWERLGEEGKAEGESGRVGIVERGMAPATIKRTPASMSVLLPCTCTCALHPISRTSPRLLAASC